MKKKSTTSQSGFFGPRLLVAVLLCAGVGCLVMAGTLPVTTGKVASLRSEAPANASQRALTFAERVSYQRAIEDVYWRHRIWPKERPDPKPSLDAVMTQVQLERKVADYLRNSQALEDYWKRPITADQLQAEMNRMAQHTKQPVVLHELFEALGNDPFVIAECLARPVLAERLLAKAGEQVKQTNGTYGQVAAATGNYSLPPISDEGGCIDDSWTPTTSSNAPTGRSAHTAVWTGTEMIVWGGYEVPMGTNGLNTGGRYNPSTDSWAATTIANAPTARYAHTAVWTGSEMIVWGGNGDNTGGRYNPATNSWTATSIANAPTGRWNHTAVWTGSEMIVWGGFDLVGFLLNSGGKYDPNTNSWTSTSTSNAPDPRTGHTAAWTGSEMIVWGGYDYINSIYFNTGGRYNPTTNTWVSTSTTSAPAGRYGHTAIWTGSQMIVWGGGFYDTAGNHYFNSGGRYNPNTNSWTATSTGNVPQARAFHTAVWTGSEMIVWGGLDENDLPFNTGGKYNPTTSSWTTTSITNVPAARAFHTAVRIGSEMIVWGGTDASNYFNTGGRYCAPFLGSQLGNISTRAFVQTGDNVMIGGFIVQGNQTKSVIIRAVGPELGGPPYNIPNPLYNPTLELHDGTGALIASNDNWRTTIIGGIITRNQVADIINSGYAPTDGRESAIIAELAPGNYTAIVSGVDNMTGVALVEVYDLSSDASSILANISTRSFVQTGDNVMIGGFIVEGSQPKSVIIRAIGPELTQYGVPDVLADPTLELHDATGALIASNDNWQHTIIGGIITSDQVQAIMDSGHAPTDPTESAIIATLPAGNYTAIVRGVSNTTGVALAEVYDLGQ